MRDRTLAVIFTVVVVVLLGCPGLAFLCFGLTEFIAYYGFNNPFYVTTGGANFLGISGLCIGAFLIIITIIAGFFLLRKKTGLPPQRLDEPLPPSSPDVPLPPTSSDLPLPPTSPDEPIPPTSPDEPIPPMSSDEPLPPTKPDEPIPPTSTDEPLPPSL
jgi:hypothetical protein